MPKLLANALRIACAVMFACASSLFMFAADPASADAAYSTSASVAMTSVVAEIQNPVAFKTANYISPNLLAIVQQTKESAKPKPVFDKKFATMSVVSMALTIADIERTQSCLHKNRCEELDPLLPHSRAGMYAVNLPVNAGLMYLSYRLKASGRKTWWIAPLGISAGHFVGATFKF